VGSALALRAGDAVVIGTVGKLLLRRVPTVLLVPAWVAVAGVALVVAVARRPVLVYPATVLAALAAAALWWGWPAVAWTVAGGLLGAALAVASWTWLAPNAWAHHVVLPLRSWRRRRYYEARWEAAMDGCGLIRADELPTLMRVRGGEAVDELLVHMAAGSLVTEWRDAAPRLASALEVRSVRVRKDGPRDVRLLVRHAAVTPHEWPADVDAEADEIAEQLTAEPAEYPPDPFPSTPREPATPPVPAEPAQPRPAFPRRPR
jgi:hypothetical protein